jgi:hypothetical protein
MLLLPYVDNFVCFTANGMVVSMLEEHLSKAAGATKGEVALIFLLMGASYMSTTPLAGWVNMIFLYEYFEFTMLKIT